MIERITSPHNARIKQALRLHSSRGRQTLGRMIVFGTREVNRAIASGVVFEDLFIAESDSPEVVERLQAVVDPRETRINHVADTIHSKIAFGDRTDEIIGIAPPPSSELGALSLENRETPGIPLVVVLQAIEKPGNLGAIFRTADACGVSAIVCADPLTDVFHPNSIRASTGAVFNVPSARGSSSDVQDWLRKNHLNVLTATLEDARDYYETDLSVPTAIVLGNEANGLNDDWTHAEFQAVKLPMLGIADSLNVSVTASVMLYEAMRQRTC